MTIPKKGNYPGSLSFENKKYLKSFIFDDKNSIDYQISLLKNTKCSIYGASGAVTLTFFGIPNISCATYDLPLPGPPAIKTAFKMPLSKTPSVSNCFKLTKMVLQFIKFYSYINIRKVKKDRVF